MSLSIHDEVHLSNRSQWLRAAVLGANDGLISTASLLVGIAAANANSQNSACRRDSGTVMAAPGWAGALRSSA